MIAFYGALLFDRMGAPLSIAEAIVIGVFTFAAASAIARLTTPPEAS